MFTRIKTITEIDHMRTSGHILASILQTISKKVDIGMTGKDVSILAAQELKALGGTPSFLGYMDFPDVICISLNDTIVHGIPNNVAFKKGDVASFDFGVTYNGMITDSAFTMIVGGGEDKNTAKLLKATERSLYAGIEVVHDGVKVGDIAAAVEKVLDSEHLGIVRELVGHGVGHRVHEDPNIPNYGMSGTGSTLKSGMTIAIEPMATLGSYQVKAESNGWGIATVDKSLSAHFEHTVLITPDSFEILTVWE